MPSKKKPKLTKKMLGHLDRAEIRSVLMHGMGVEPEVAYQKDNKWCVSYIYDNQGMFAEADLTGIHPGERFRPTVFDYIKNLQLFLAGDIEAPTWPPADAVPVATPVAPVVKEVEVTRLLPPSAYDEHPVESERVSSDALDLSDLRAEAYVNQDEQEIQNPTHDTDEASPEDEPTVSSRGKAIEAPLNTGAPKMTIQFSKVDGFGNEGAAQDDEALSTQVDYDYFNESFDNLGEHIDNHAKIILQRIEDVEKQVKSLENALLYIINSAILPKDVVVSSLDEIPKPPY